MNLEIHKRRGYKWTVTVNLDWIKDEDDPLFDWLTENFGEEDFEHGAWARIFDGVNFSRYDITDRKIMTMLMLRWL